jgi:hypothetical protein
MISITPSFLEKALKGATVSARQIDGDFRLKCRKYQRASSLNFKSAQLLVSVLLIKDPHGWPSQGYLR